MNFGPRKPFFKRITVFFMFLIVEAYGQTATLAVGSGSGVPGTTVSIGIILTGSAQPAGLQWSLTYPSASVSNVMVTAGSSAINAGKSIYCSGGAGSSICLLAGLNSTGMADGSIAVASFQIVSGTAAPSIPIQISQVVAVSPSGGSIAASGT